MGWVSGVAIYVIIWWLVIFMVLPWGVQPISAEDVKKGHASSAPQRPHMLIKAAATTGVAAALWLLLYWALDSGALRFDR